jgi:membrane-associated phospholipid phosphatase
LAGLVATYVVFGLTPWGRHADTLSYLGRWGTTWTVRSADLALLQTVSIMTVLAALVTLVVVAGLRGRWRTGLGAATAVLGSVLSAEALKVLLPSANSAGQWRWLSFGSFPSGHAVVVTSIALAVLSVSSAHWRRILVGPMLAWTAVATTATVTVGWHRPSDVLGSLFLATAWHRACTARVPEAKRLRSLLRWSPKMIRTAPNRHLGVRPGVRPALPGLAALSWWGLACLLVLGAAVEGALAGRDSPGRLSSAAYLVSLTVLLAGAGLTIASTWTHAGRSGRPHAVSTAHATVRRSAP